MDVDARLWRSFTTVAEELHYGRAAERLHITQPALSRQIRDLERALGVTLFDRTSRRVVLSQAGRAVLGQARRALTEADRAVRLARLAARGDWGELAISVLPAVALGLTVVAASYQALTLDGVRFVPIAGHQLALQVAWAAGNTSTALPAFLETARLIARQTDPVPAAGPQAREP